VKEVMSEPPITITPHVTIQEAARLMMERKIGCLPVVDGVRLVGIVSETDMLKLIVEMD
jgi:acetoin utilization protein AcuB